MRVARLLLCYVLLEDYSTNLGGAAITSDTARQDASATNPTLPDLPTFVGSIGNVTAAIGKEVVLPCTIRMLGNHMVGWIRVEDNTILSMGEKTVTHARRFHVTLENAKLMGKMKNQSQSTRDEEFTTKLHISQLRVADRGCYMCQLNTKPMLSQLGCVDVLVPPDILSTGTSEGEVSVQEGENATLSCNASGRPTPRVDWRREKGSILMRGLHDPLMSSVGNYTGEKLELTRVDRRQMGAYLCIARNDVPPAVSKRVYLRVNFPPSTIVPNQLLGSPLDSDVSLTCLIEAYPKTINLWTRDGQVIMSGGRYDISERAHPDEEWKTTSALKIRHLQERDIGEYTCSASSSMGKSEATIRIYQIKVDVTPPTRATSVTGKKLSKGKSKLAQVTAVNRVFQQMSTPAMQKSTAKIAHNKYITTSTTVDPRSPFIKDKNVFKNRDTPSVRNDCGALNENRGARVYAICLIVFLILR
ncbi:lachesin-like [Ceratina calcarata]|uniref:Lachesin-like n=1 Tax=Ceratina calcarata TaxID=156304 RepID=A0AAJ7IVN7_9HYME|nr:lachesin-like [Ceratina calcarata]